MRKSRLFVVLLMASAGSVFGQPSTSGEQELLQVQAKRYQAVLAGDMKNVERMVADELSYCHANAWVQTKAEYLNTVRTKQLKWLTMVPQGMKVHVYGDSAVIVGRLHETLVSNQEGKKPQSLDVVMRTIEIYVRRDGRWQLADFQAARVPDDQLSANAK